MKLKFIYYMPTRIIFGAGELSKLANTPYLPGKKALVVISSANSMVKYGLSKHNGNMDVLRNHHLKSL